MGAFWRRACLLYAGRICNGRNRLHQSKNAGNIIMKNLMDFCIGTPTFWIVGFGIMFGAGNGFFGKIGGIATEANYGSAMLPDGVPFWAFLIFQTVFCATSATIVSGAMAERTKFSSYCIYSFLISLIVYPVSGHWIWGRRIYQPDGLP